VRSETQRAIAGLVPTLAEAFLYKIGKEGPFFDHLPKKGAHLVAIGVVDNLRNRSVIAAFFFVFV
jgi:hypothetical protein